MLAFNHMIMIGNTLVTYKIYVTGEFFCYFLYTGILGSLSSTIVEPSLGSLERRHTDFPQDRHRVGWS